MSYAIYKGEKNMSELVSRLFRLQGKGAQAAAKQAADGLLKANPQLKDFSKLAIGSVITVPATAPPVLPSELADAAAMTSPVATRTQNAVAAGDQLLTITDTRAIAATTSFLGLAKSPQLRTLMANNPDLKQGFAQIVATTTELLKELEANAAPPKG
jgi:hypothetical protein